MTSEIGHLSLRAKISNKIDDLQLKLQKESQAKIGINHYFFFSMPAKVRSGANHLNTETASCCLEYPDRKEYRWALLYSNLFNSKLRFIRTVLKITHISCTCAKLHAKIEICRN